MTYPKTPKKFNAELAESILNDPAKESSEQGSNK
jgi:hypothetical protein